MQRASVLCYGEIDLDIYLAVSALPALNRAAFVTKEFDNIGGAAANSAIWLANWEVATRIVGTELGEDRSGRLVREQFANYPHLDTQYLNYNPNQLTPRCQCLVTPDGERTFILHWLGDSHTSALTLDMLTGIKWLNLDMSGHLEPRLNAARLAKDNHISVLINDIYSADHPLLAFVDINVISASVARTKRPDVSPLELAELLRKQGDCDVIITDGSQAVTALLRSGDKIICHPPSVTTIDSTGAGDIFKAGLLYGLVNDMPLPQALRWATAAGAAKVGVAGTTLNPSSLKFVEEMLAGVC